MKTTIISFIILLLASATAHAQNSLFRMYRFECSKLYNIELTKPKGFDVIDGQVAFRVNEKYRIANLYRMLLQSKNKDCLLLFPYFDTSRSHDATTRNMVNGEVEAALNVFSEKSIRMRFADGQFWIGGASEPTSENETMKLGTAKYIKMIVKDNMDDYFNADTVFIYKVPLPKSYKEIYSQCIGINVIKKGHPSAMMKILLTEESKKKEDEYIQILLGSIHYGDVAPKYNKEKRDKITRIIKNRFPFYNKKYFRGFHMLEY